MSPHWASPAEPRALADPAQLEHRKALRDLPHVKPLKDFATGLQAEKSGSVVPFFDPLDGGTQARALFLLEKPGPKTVPKKGGSGFISRDNDDRTAAATFNFMKEAGIPRCMTMLWNVIPWWDGKVKATKADLDAGILKVGSLVDLLPLLRCVVLVGRNAHSALPAVASLEKSLCILAPAAG